MQAKLGKALIIAIFGLTIPFVNPVGEREISPTLHPAKLTWAIRPMSLLPLPSPELFTVLTAMECSEASS